jgi:hypothetical protein
VLSLASQKSNGWDVIHHKQKFITICHDQCHRTMSGTLQDHILRDTRVCDIDFDFDNVLDDHFDIILTFNIFISMDSVPI